MIISIVTHTIIIAVSIRLTGAVAESVAETPGRNADATDPCPGSQGGHRVAAPAGARVPPAPALPIVPPMEITTGIPPVPVGRPFDPHNLGATPPTAGELMSMIRPRATCERW